MSKARALTSILSTFWYLRSTAFKPLACNTPSPTSGPEYPEESGWEGMIGQGEFWRTPETQESLNNATKADIVDRSFRCRVAPIEFYVSITSLPFASNRVPRGG